MSDPNVDSKLYYYTVRYWCQLPVDFYKRVTSELYNTRLTAPDRLDFLDVRDSVRSAANPSTEMVSYRNMLLFGADWFELYRQNALTFGFSADENAGALSYQLSVSGSSRKGQSGSLGKI